MKKSLSLGVILLFLLSALAPMSLGFDLKNVMIEQPTINQYNGNTLYVGGSGEDNYTTIQDAINDAVNGDTVYVYDESSPYFEEVFINHSIDLIGENNKTTIINGTLYNNCININTDYVTISGFTIENKIDKRGIWADSSDKGLHLNVSNNIIKNCHIAIVIFGEYSNIFNNQFISNSRAIDIRLGSRYQRIEGNYIYNTVEMGSNIIAEISFFGASDNNVIVNNTLISKNGCFGTVIDMGEAAFCRDNIISGNHIKSYDGTCIYVYNGRNNVLSGNILENNGQGISLNLCFNNEVSGNAFLNNDRGISLSKLSLNNKIHSNNFINNNENAYFKILSIKNNWEANYWDIPRTEPYAIIGKLILFIPWIEYDYNPALEPYDIEV